MKKVINDIVIIDNDDKSKIEMLVTNKEHWNDFKIIEDHLVKNGCVRNYNVAGFGEALSRYSMGSINFELRFDEYFGNSIIVDAQHEQTFLNLLSSVPR